LQQQQQQQQPFVIDNRGTPHKINVFSSHCSQTQITAFILILKLFVSSKKLCIVAENYR
jgi:hypothetical protein